MERLNEAVDALKRRHAMEHKLKLQKEEQEEEEEANQEPTDVAGDKGAEVQSTEKTRRKVQRRGRSRSVDGVTFSPSATSRLVYDKSANASETMMSLEGESVVAATTSSPTTTEVFAESAEDDREAITSHVKRSVPPEGILKPPSTRKRCRATSFDISTGPSTYTRRSYHRNESSSSLLAGSANWGSTASSHGEHFVPQSGTGTIDEDEGKLHPLIPQPSLYQSSLSEHHHNGSDKGPTMVPRRLMTDLILTLNASFPDYDFGDAQTSDFCTLSTTEAMRRVNDKLGEFASTTDEGRDFLPRFWNALDDVLFRGLGDCEVYSYAPQGTGEDDPLEFLTMSMANENDGSANADAGGGGIANAPATKRGNAVVFTPSGGGRIISKDMLADGLDTSMMALDLPNQISPASGSDASPHVTLWSMNYFFVSKNKKRIVLVACVETLRTPQGGEDDEGSDGLYDEYSENNLVFDEARREGIVGEAKDEYTNMMIGQASSGEKAELLSSPMRGGDGESMSVVVEDTEQGLDVDGEFDQGENDFDTGTMSIPSQVA